MSRVGAQYVRLAQTTLSDLPILFTDWLDLSQTDSKHPAARNRLFTPTRTLWLFLAQILSADGSCTEAVRRALTWLASEGDEASPDSSAYCQARQRLSQDYLQELIKQVSIRLEEKVSSRWCGRAVKVVDGSTLSMPDTLRNQKEYPQPDGQKAGCGFPMMRLVGLFSLASGGLLAYASGNLRVGELALWRQLWSSLSPGDVVLADRNFSGYAYLGMLLGQGVDSVVRLNASRSKGSRVLEKLGPGEYLVEWTKSGNCPEWMTAQEWQELPGTLIVRQIDVKIQTPGCRTDSISIVTTLFDRKRFPRKVFGSLYRQRWQVELFLQTLKTTMKMDVLRTKSPEMIRKELAMHLLAYNLIRGLMAEAAGRTPPKAEQQISFKQSVDFVRTWAPMLAALENQEKRENMQDMLLRYIARSIVRARPNRSEPRAVKRRQKNYPLLNKPRAQYTAIPHRNKYRKPQNNA
jgi:Transposase DDE domain/Insertion element 4 transposase N-terminal